MKKFYVLTLAAAMCAFVFAGCETKDAPADVQSEAENNVEVTEENLNNEVEEVEGAIIAPLPSTIDIENLDNCTVAVSLAEGDSYTNDEGKAMMKVTVYGYDLYDMVDIAALKEGDSILRGDEYTVVTSVERTDAGLVIVNGGLENGGFYLSTDESTVYFETGFNDAKAYYALGEKELPISTEFVYTDSSDLENEPVEYFAGDILENGAVTEYDFTPYNTEIVISDGFVVEMHKHYLP